MPTTAPRLRLVSGESPKRLVELTGRVTLGRLGSLEVPIKDTKASREHARVFEQGGDWHIVDLNSTNGTLVNGANITRRALRAGDEITIGTTVYVFEMPEPPPEPTAPPPPKVEPVVRRPAEPEAAPEIGAEPIVVKQKSLHFHRIEGGKSFSPLKEDVGQRGGLYRLLVIAGMLVVMVIIFFVVTKIVASMVATDEDEDLDGLDEGLARTHYSAIA